MVLCIIGISLPLYPLDAFSIPQVVTAKNISRDFPGVQQLGLHASTAEFMGSISGPRTKILHAMTKKKEILRHYHMYPPWWAKLSQVEDHWYVWFQGESS